MVVPRCWGNMTECPGVKPAINWHFIGEKKGGGGGGGGGGGVAILLAASCYRIETRAQAQETRAH